MSTSPPPLPPTELERWHRRFPSLLGLAVLNAAPLAAYGQPGDWLLVTSGWAIALVAWSQFRRHERDRPLESTGRSRWRWAGGGVALLAGALTWALLAGSGDGLVALGWAVQVMLVSALSYSYVLALVLDRKAGRLPAQAVASSAP